jgi:hypothetical protein
MARIPLRSEFKVLLGMAAVLLVPFALTLLTVKEPRPIVSDLAGNPTPYGYTWSLTLFVIPVAVLATWVTARKHSAVQKRAFWLTAALLSGAGILLDVCFGLNFFTFVNRQATLGITFWGYRFGEGWQKAIPIEEIGFYTFGIVAVLLAYIWGDEIWFDAYNLDDSRRKQLCPRDLFSFHPHSAVFGAVVFVAGLLYRKFGPHPWHEGFPGYFLFLTSVALTPSIIFFRVANPFINWRAFSLAFLFILLVSLFWEAAIAVPYQWWGFQSSQMLGLLINGFCGLPVEEPLLWLGVTWATVIVYETIYTWVYIESGIPRAG